MEFVLYIVLAIAGFFIIMNLYMRLSGFLKKGKMVPEFGGEIGSKVKAGKKLLLYFYSPNCGACRPMTPVIDDIRKRNSDVYKIDLSQDMKLGRIFGVMGTPATVLVEDKKINKFILGARSENFIKKLI
jgi:thioredoxin 1